MLENMQAVYLAIPLLCLAAAAIAGLAGGRIGRAGAHGVTIFGVGAAFLLSFYVALDVFRNGHLFNGPVYSWLSSGGYNFQVGFLIDQLTATMMVVVTFVSLMVHIYTIGYMADDEHNWPKDSLAGKNSYQRFFSYISLFTFSMLMLVMSNNFIQLFFGWEAVGLVSYLLIGFWFNRESAIFANMKAFLVNRVGDFGFLLGIAAIFAWFGTLDYDAVFGIAPSLASQQIHIAGSTHWSLITFICIALFVGAMGKSAQVPLHVWLPDSMEGPTPISALIHAATMVTAGIFMVARMSPLYEMSETALSLIIIIGAITALFMGLLGIIQYDIKRVIAYSTLSQLGYMTVGLGASAYNASIFHLGTHAFFKALLFLGAGSVIIAMHHAQDMRRMGGLRRFMPITYFTMIIGSLALSGIPPFAGFFSKDAIIEAVHHSHITGSGFAYFSVVIGAFITAFYSFRLIFMTFHGKPRMDEHTRKHLKESPAVVIVPLLLLAIPSVMAGWQFIEPMLYGDFFGDAIRILPRHNAFAEAGEHGFSAWHFMKHGAFQPPVLLALIGMVSAYIFYVARPDLAGEWRAKLAPAVRVLENNYYFDKVYQAVFAGGALRLGSCLWKSADVKMIDGFINGLARAVGWVSGKVRLVQSGYLYHYAFVMIIGLFLMISWFLYL